MCGEHGVTTLVASVPAGSSPLVRGALYDLLPLLVPMRIIPACAGSTKTQMPHVRRIAGSSPLVRGARILTGCGFTRHGIIPASAGSTPRTAGFVLAWEDHPRLCGEHFEEMVAELSSMGSSPLVRGARDREHSLYLWPGIIPACAGSTASVQPTPSLDWDHPRLCGEHSVPQGQRSESKGSSPLVRGARPSRPRERAEFGIIPACAGSTPFRRPSRRSSRDHPRLCGEHLVVSSCSDDISGSSPLVRGAPHALRLADLDTGIIPACAGSTSVPGHSNRLHKDHPRLCGEHRRSSDTARDPAGSSPLVRGALLARDCVLLYRGIIPACAGSTSTACGRPRSSPDHPRLCGEHLLALDAIRKMAGSSPLVRGALLGHPRGDRVDGIIPACAGSTYNLDFDVQMLGDHPRLCGEHLRYKAEFGKDLGSSPLVRGARALLGVALTARGIIPACAGSTFSSSI